MAKLSGKVAIVTGGARGIGAACAETLCREGAAVLLTDLLEAEGAATAQRLRDAGHKAAFARHDVRDAASWAAAVAQAESQFGRVDCLVNNAGITNACTIEDATEADFRRMLDINLIGPFLGMQAVAPAMKRQGGGAIVNISSNSTDKVLALTTIYGATKAAVANLTKTAAVHFAETGSGIRVNSVHPGPTETPMLLGGAAHAADIPLVRALISSIPMRRMGKPPEIASVIAFLLSDEASYMTGSEVFIDGGLTMV